MNDSNEPLKCPRRIKYTIMKFVSAIHLVLILFCHNLYACSAAYQYSLFPLGSSMGQIILIEVEMNRYLSTPDQQMMRFGDQMNQGNQVIEVRWKGTVRLMRLEQDSLRLEKDLGSTDLLDEAYAKTMQGIFEEALHVAQKLPLFEEAIVASRGICHFDRSCSLMKLRIDTTAAKFFVESTENGYETASKEVHFSYETLKKVENTTKIKFTDFKNIDKDYQIDFFRLWSPQTVRRYTIAGQTVLVYSIGRGDKSRYTLSKESKRKHPNLADVSYLVQGNDVLFHGQRFDLIQIL